MSLNVFRNSSSAPALRTRAGVLVLTALAALSWPAQAQPQHSVARLWIDECLDSIRVSRARPPVHARNLFHLSAALWDACAAYGDEEAQGFLIQEKLDVAPASLKAAREEAMSYAAFRLLSWRFANSEGASDVIPSLANRLSTLGFDPQNTSSSGNTPAALGNRIAEAYIDFGLGDGSNEANDHVNRFYQPVNDPFTPELGGNPTLTDENRWQPISFVDGFVDQSNIPTGISTPEFLGPEWGEVTPYAMTAEDLTVFQRDGRNWPVYHDPGPPPYFRSPTQELYQDDFQVVIEASAELDPTDGVIIDISPATRGNNALGRNDGGGHPVNPVTGQPYTAQNVPAGDYYRVIAEFWADGPDSETPPGHWFSIANDFVNDSPLLERRIGGVGPELDPLEWDVKLYLALGGAMHDAAIAAWSVKGYYDYIRPISALRAVLARGQRSDPSLPGFNSAGVRIVPGVVEVITFDSIKPGERHEALSFFASGGNVGKIAVRTWRGPLFITNQETQTSGVDWILLDNWWPYQRPSFITPPFAGYVSGHSTFSRAASELLTRFTGSPYFPGGLAEYPVERNEFLVFEDGPSVDLSLQWATYYDASDESSISRIYGGIHPPADDVPGRIMGAQVGSDAMERSRALFGTGACTATATTHCLNGGRYRVEVTYTDFAGNSGSGQTVAGATDDSGLYWFFESTNWEMMVKVLDGCAVNNRVWVFGAATTDVAYEITVTDTMTGEVQTYTNELGEASAAITDTDAFDTCSAG
ncbi:MAG: vanadium-dependent haloperoxidase [Acidobacteriota bacterium]